MAGLKIRPRFTLEIDRPVDQVIQELRRLLDRSPTVCQGTVANHYVILRVPDGESHFWSPRLTLDLREEGGKTIITGLFGPQPVVWMMFAGFYLASIFLGFVGLMWGAAQWTLGLEPKALWLLLASLLALGIAYAGAFVGQKLGEEQMHFLKGLVDETLGSTPPSATR
ncbi:MAG: hypothetical protein D6681_01470 [Calditrichaeota bacterium]|nr:MAG: hypothetical protein D6681_01470 [Calditrichota bacterium]